MKKEEKQPSFLDYLLSLSVFLLIYTVIYSVGNMVLGVNPQPINTAICYTIAFIIHLTVLYDSKDDTNAEDEG